MQTAVHTPAASDDITTGYTNSGKPAYVIDAENNRTAYSYDGHNRLVKTEYPSTTKGANAVNASDYEELTYDANGNITSRRLRDGSVIAFAHDKLNRVITKDLPGTEADTSFTYDLLGRPLSITKGSDVQSFAYDPLGRKVQEVSSIGTVGYSYDAAGRRTSMTYPGSALTINYDYDVTGNVTAIRENGATTGVGRLASYSYDALGRPSNVAFGNGTSQAFTYDGASRLASLTNNLDGAATTNDLSLGFSYNRAGQIKTATRSNDAYAWTHHVNVDRPYVVDGLNRVASAGATSFGYDARGNLNLSGSQAYGYSSENMMISGPDGFTASYDPLGRLKSTSSTTAPLTHFGYDGLGLIAELDASSIVQHRYVHGPGTDNPIIWYNGSLINNSTRRFLMADERGSIISVADSSGSTIHINSYDEYGIPAPGNTGRFGFTGQTWLSEIGMWYFKARIYSPTLGRFLQTDPIGYEDGLNWYNYVGGDPINNIDPLGMDIVVTGNKPQNPIGGEWFPMPTVPAYSVRDRLREMNPGTGSGHKYDTTEKICSVPLSQSERGQINRATAVPDGMIVPSRSEGTYPVGGWLLGIVPITGGYVTTRFSANGNIAVNTTTSAHLFVGTITRTIYSSSSGTFIRTVGSGNAGSGIVGRARDRVNDAIGPSVFGDSNSMARKYAKEINPSC